MKCPKCGGEVCEKDSFCEKCGTALAREKMISFKKLLTAASMLGVFLLVFWIVPGFTANVSPAPTITSDLDSKSFTSSVGIAFVLIPAGEFDMGSPLSEVGRDVDEGPIHHVKLANNFYMGKYEVTQKQWRDIMGTDPSNFKGDNLPVENVSWYDVQEFIKKLNEKDGTNKYRLPSEAEWEYAERAGTMTSFSFGDDESKLDDYAWYSDNSKSMTHPTGQKKPNAWGLYDMHGNVAEWVDDMYHSNYTGAPVDGSSWREYNPFRVLRGCAWVSGAGSCRSAYRDIAPREYRYFSVEGKRYYSVGFRLVMDL